MNASIPLARPNGLARTTPYPALLTRLSEMSVKKQFDPFRDIDWDTAENRVDLDDPRLALPSVNPLAATAWYRGLAPKDQIRLGIEHTAQVLKYGIGFEALLSRGLLRFSQTVPNRSPEFRYAMHEVVEEGRHSLMFQELVDRLGSEPQTVTGFVRFANDRIERTGRTAPCFFMFCVLAGEIFIDQFNREILALDRKNVHPLVRRIMQIHVTEEARHVCFAEQYLRQHLPKASNLQRAAISYLVPVILADTPRMMLQPDRRLRRMFRIPSATLREAYGPGTQHRATVAATVEPIYKLFQEHDMLRSRHAAWWRVLGLHGT
jgi:P-aminobenzoate N-oxygenase AurF